LRAPIKFNELYILSGFLFEAFEGQTSLDGKNWNLPKSVKGQKVLEFFSIFFCFSDLRKKANKKRLPIKASLDLQFSTQIGQSREE
jgi:hypothetical protein